MGVVLEVAEEYDVDYLLLEKSHVDSLSPLYESPESMQDFVLLKRIDDSYLFEIAHDD